jgi:hypothetical protein
MGGGSGDPYSGGGYREHSRVCQNSKLTLTL